MRIEQDGESRQGFGGSDFVSRTVKSNLYKPTQAPELSGMITLRSEAYSEGSSSQDLEITTK